MRKWALPVLAWAAALFFAFCFFDRPHFPDLAVNLAAGAATVIITMLLLKMQSGAEMRKEHDAKLLEARLALYDRLMEELKQILQKEKVTPEVVVAVQLLNQRVAAIAGEDTVKAFGRFTDTFSKVAGDPQLTADTRDELLGVAAEVSAAMRKDVVPKDDQGKLEARQLAKDVAERAKSLSKPGVTTEEDFMARCADDEERRFYKDVLAFLAQKGIPFAWCSSGFSIKDHAGTSVV